MLKVSKLSDYAAAVAARLAGQNHWAPAKQLAIDMNLTLPTMNKVLNLLLGAGLVVSRQGAQGGYKLARDAQSITMADIIAAVEGQSNLTECVPQEGSCVHEQHCQVQPYWRQIHHEIAAVFQRWTLADLIKRDEQQEVRIPLDTVKRGSV